MERIFNGIFLAFAMTIGVAAGFLIVAPWPPGIAPDQTITITAAIIAALGTWAVGLGAMHFADAAHQLRVSELQEAAKGEFILLRSYLINCQLTIRLYNKMVAPAGLGTLTLRARHTILRTMVSLLPSVPIGASLALAEKFRAKSQAIDIYVAMIKVGVNEFMETYPKEPPAKDIPLMVSNFEHVIGQFQRLAKLSLDLGEAEDELHGITPSKAPPTAVA